MNAPDDRLDRFDRFLDGIPIARNLRFALTLDEDDEVALSMPIDERSLQIEGRVHGGLLATLADTAAVWLVHRNLPPDRWMTGIDFTLHFLRPALGGLGDLVATACPMRRGRRVTVAEVKMTQAGDLVAKGVFTYLTGSRR